MTVKTPQTSLSRIRDNQRRSRARRKEYLQDLEDRLRKFEARGVQATREVQAAGRKVAVENTLLRSLLRLQGVSDREVQAYLTAHEANGYQRHPLPQPQFQSQVGPAVEVQVQSQLQTWESPRGDTDGDVFYDLEARAESQLAPLLLHSGRDGPWLTSVATTDPNIGPPPLFPASGRELPMPEDRIPGEKLSRPHVMPSDDAGDSTPCEAAAGILASMRGYSDGRDVRLELGCQPGSSCMVRNLDIFQLLDT